MSINTESLTEQLVTIIKSMILNNELKSGEQIPTQKIAAKYGVSVMPVRSALRELADRKLVTVRSRVGFFVKEYSISELLQISDCRQMFEVYCLDRFFDNLDLGELRALKKSIMENQGEHFSESVYLKDEFGVHSSIVFASKNEFLIQQYCQLNDLFSLGIRYDNKKPDLVRLTIEEHLRLLDCILNGEKEAALIELKNHLERAVSMIHDFERVESGVVSASGRHDQLTLCGIDSISDVSINTK